MKQEKLNKEEFLNIVDKFLNGNSSFAEEEILINHFESFQYNNEWETELGLEEDVKQNIHSKILSKINDDVKQPTKVININYKKFIKYAAAILIVFSTGYFLVNKEMTKKNPYAIKINNNIPIGTDKASLTLEDGSIIELEKGKEYSQVNAKSDGEKIVYTASSIEKNKRVKEKIAFNYLTIPRGGEFFVELADGTKVWLNSETQIKYPTKFVKGEMRKVELLYGEAYFEVSPSDLHNGDKFNVISEGQEIEVLGTQFNIKAYKDEDAIKTTLVEGKIALKTDNTNEILLPSQQSIYDKTNKEVVFNNVDVYNEISWRHGEFNFNNKTLDEIMIVLSRWYDVEIEVQNKENQKFKYNGTLGKNQNIEIILLTLKNTNNLKYKITNDKIIIK
ncbi:FecR family protein [uncultured Lutibacter sp.]|uniref:FecR family protein n=1 Tax=uncultured Lutibacter sp. TaxID=437739 RepID=UPI0026100B8B|nr:FecR family protein [uncultured Lutibacter sp.]